MFTLYVCITVLLTPFSRHGQKWKKIIAEAGSVKKFTSIRRLMEAICWGYDDLFRGTVREDDWSFYHDGLTHWFGKAGQEYLKEMKTRDGLVPKHSYHRRQMCIRGSTNRQVAAHYVGKIVGNRPEGESHRAFFAPRFLRTAPLLTRVYTTQACP